MKKAKRNDIDLSLDDINEINNIFIKNNGNPSSFSSDIERKKAEIIIENFLEDYNKQFIETTPVPQSESKKVSGGKRAYTPRIRQFASTILGLFS